MDVFLDNLMTMLGANVLNAVAALAILVIGWLVALIISRVVRGVLRRTKLDDKLAKRITGEEKDTDNKVEAWVSKGVFWLIMLFVLVAFFQTLGLTVITEPLNQLLVLIFQYLPQVLGAGILLLLAWVIATMARLMIKRALGLAKLDERLRSSSGMEEGKEVPITNTFGEVVYWLVYLLFLPAILDALELQGLLGPVQGMLEQILGSLPSLLGAVIILLIGWFAARILQRIVSNLLAATGIDRFSKQVGLDSVLGKQTLSGLIGLVIYVLIFIPVIIASLNALGLDAITGPASNMLDVILLALPVLFTAALVLVLAYIVGRVVSKMVVNLLSGIGFDNILAKLGFDAGVGEGKQTPSAVVGYLTMVAIMLFAATEAAQMLGLTILSELVSEFTVFAGQILVGLIIFAIGMFLANLAARTIQTSSAKQSKLLAVIARISILVLAGAMSLRQMGLANEIVETGFGLLLGAIAVAVALAFGLGGRDIAAKELASWVESIKNEKPQE
jgi:hypothetical protein